LVTRLSTNRNTAIAIVSSALGTLRKAQSRFSAEAWPIGAWPAAANGGLFDPVSHRPDSGAGVSSAALLGSGSRQPSAPRGAAPEGVGSCRAASEASDGA